MYSVFCFPPSAAVQLRGLADNDNPDAQERRRRAKVRRRWLAQEEEGAVTVLHPREPD